MSRQSKIEAMREVLEQRRVALRKAIEGDDSLLRNFGQSQGDAVDFALSSASVEIGSQIAEASSRELKLVEMALQRIDDKSYGKCQACNKNIPLARLQALPYAVLCIKCKRVAEEAGLDPSKVVDWSQILDSDSSSPDLGVNFT